MRHQQRLVDLLTARGPLAAPEVGHALSLLQPNVYLERQVRNGTLIRTDKHLRPVYYGIPGAHLPMTGRPPPLKRLRQALAFGPLDTTTLCSYAGVSQPAFSRDLRRRLLADEDFTARRVGSKTYYMLSSAVAAFETTGPGAK